MADQTVKERMEIALRESSPSSALAILARTFKAEGMSQSEIYQLFDEYRARIAKDANEIKYDAILDTMDIICGHCNPAARLFDTDLP